MPETATLQTTQTVGSNTYTKVVTSSAASLERASPSVPAAKVGSLTTRTDNDTGVATMTSGHGFVTSNKIDLFWSGGKRRNMTATVATDAVTLDGGTGDNLPVVNTAVTAMKPVEVLMDLDGDEVLSVGVYSAQIGYVVFVDDAAADIATATYSLTANSGDGWVDGSDGSNPLAGVVVSKVKFSHGYSTGAATMRAEVTYGTPP